MSVKHLHDCKHYAHSGTRTICPLISILDQRIVIVRCPHYRGWIHPRKSTSSTAGKLIPVLLTYLTQHLKSHYLGSFPRSSSFRFCPPFLPERVLGYKLVWSAILHTMVVPLGILHSSNRGAVHNTPHNARLSKVGQGYQTSIGNSHFQPVLPSVPTTWCNSRETRS